MLTIMNKYQIDNKEDLFKATAKSQDHQKLIQLSRDRNWTRIYNTAREEFAINNIIDDRTYYEWFMSYRPLTTHDLMTKQQTDKYVTEYCKEQCISPAKLLTDLYDVLRMNHNKVNGFYMQGQSNAGKTFFLKGVVPVDSKPGYHTTSKEFPFGYAVNAPLLIINELTIESPAKAELYKNVIGGEPTQINIKNRPSQLMNRKPVLITSNDVIWRYVSDQKQTLMNRMKCYLHLRKSKVTQEYSKYGRPNPTYFQAIFKNFEKAEKSDQQEEGATAFSPELDTSNPVGSPEWTTDEEIETMDTQEYHNASTDTIIIGAADKDTGSEKQDSQTQTYKETSEKQTQTHIPLVAYEQTQTEEDPIPILELIKTPPPSPLESMPDPEEPITCEGCLYDDPSQKAHMSHGGCLFFE